MIYTAEELKIKVINARLMSRAELNEHEDNLPDIGNSCWWLSDVDENDEDYVAYTSDALQKIEALEKELFAIFEEIRGKDEKQSGAVQAPIGNTTD